MPNTDLAIDARGLARDFHAPRKDVKGLRAFFTPKTPVPALRDATFHLPVGQRTALMGVNGSGKSTLVKILSGVIHPTAGQCMALGHVPWAREGKYLRQIGVMFGQKSLLFPDLSVQDALNLYRALYGLSDDEYARQLDVLDAHLHFTHLLARPARKLSLGERMRCEVVAAVLHNPAFLILDEPTTGMDEDTRSGLLRFLMNHLRPDQTLLLTTHDANFARSVCTHALLMEAGHVTAHLPMRSVDVNADRVRIHVQRAAEVESDARFACPGADVIDDRSSALVVECAAADEERVKRALLERYRVQELRVTPAPLRARLSQAAPA